ncbi:MAG: response regulator transcription factor [Clostridium sp.]|uniref:response regulator transcription factor n=1 Tax=Clostridium sp. TaxID=1506 RepID=UPI00303F2F58
MKTILLLEDDQSLNRGISFKLKKEGYNVLSEVSVKGALDRLNNNKVDLIISDVGLEDGNGFDFCEKVRKKSDVFIIFLTALDQEIDIVTGYDLGADDYITKPFSLMVLISKVNAFMRRIENRSSSESISSNEITFIPDEMRVLKRGQEVALSKNELKLLKQLMSNPKQILSKGQLLEALWDIDGNFVDENTVAVNIRRLREKIEEVPSSPKYIRNVRGVGYIWSVECVR